MSVKVHAVSQGGVAASLGHLQWAVMKLKCGCLENIDGRRLWNCRTKKSLSLSRLVKRSMAVVLSAVSKDAV